MGVAVSVSTSTFSFNFLIFSLWVTPNRCSSSIINSPRSLNCTSADNTRWVPMTISTWPFSKSVTVFLISPGVLKRLISSTRIG